jgi:uridylate kinase
MNPLGMVPKRLMLKLSGETMKGSKEFGIDMVFVDKLSKQICQIASRGLQIAIVLGAGNIFRGAQQDGIKRSSGDYIGMLATVMNALVLGEALSISGQKVKVLTSLEMPKVADSFVMKDALEYLEQWYIVVCAGGTGNPYFTTDSAAVQKALELDCDIMIKATKVDGVYDKDPIKYSDAIKFDTMTLKQAYELGVNIMDHSAIAMAMDNDLPLFVCKIDDLHQLGSDDIVGTYVGV